MQHCLLNGRREFADSSGGLKLPDIDVLIQNETSSSRLDFTNFTNIMLGAMARRFSRCGPTTLSQALVHLQQFRRLQEPVVAGANPTAALPGPGGNLKEALLIIQRERKILRYIFEFYANGSLLDRAAAHAFAKNFNLSPDLLNRSNCDKLFFAIVKDQDGPQLTWDGFLAWLALFALNCDWMEQTSSACAAALLRWMDASKGKQALWEKAGGSILPLFYASKITDDPLPEASDGGPDKPVLAEQSFQNSQNSADDYEVPRQEEDQAKEGVARDIFGEAPLAPYGSHAFDQDAVRHEQLDDMMPAWGSLFPDLEDSGEGGLLLSQSEILSKIQAAREEDHEFLAKMAPILGLPIEGSLDLFDSVFHEMLEDGERRLALEEFREFLAARLVFSHGLDE